MGLARAEAVAGLRAGRAAHRTGAGPLRADGRGGHRPGQAVQAEAGRPRWSPPSMVDGPRGAHRRPHRPVSRCPPTSWCPGPTGPRPPSTWPARWCDGPSGWWCPSPIEGSLVGRYLNRLSDLLWAMARWTEGDHHLLARTAPRRRDRARRAGAEKPGDGGPVHRSRTDRDRELVMDIEVVTPDGLPDGLVALGVPVCPSEDGPRIVAGVPGAGRCGRRRRRSTRTGASGTGSPARSARPSRSGGSPSGASADPASPGWPAPTSSLVGVGDAEALSGDRGARVPPPGRGRLRPGRGPGSDRGAPAARRDRSRRRRGRIGGGRRSRAGRLPLRRLPHRRGARRLLAPWPSSDRAAPTPPWPPRERPGAPGWPSRSAWPATWSTSRPAR